MRNSKWAVAVGVMAMAGAICVAVQAEQKPATAAAQKFDIAQFMKDTHKGNDAMIKRAAAGSASPDEVKQLLLGYRGMAASTPPQGDMDSWKSKTAALVAATEKLANADSSAASALKQASNCKACHEIHKPK